MTPWRRKTLPNTRPVPGEIIKTIFRIKILEKWAVIH